jgi:pimeloyl-ACP methyl ester carboxylesterase
MGQDVVLVHGLSGSSRWWHEIVPALGGRARVVDVPRFGRRFRPAETAAWLAGRLDGPSVLVGHSLGGLTCAALAADRPELVRGLVLVAPVGAPSPRPLRAYATGLARTALRLRVPLLRNVVGDALRTGPLALARGGLYATRAQFAGEIAAPTLIVWGERDRLVPIELAGAWQRAVPAARLVTIPAAGHVPMIETPSAFAELVLQFLHDLDDRLRV